MQTEKGKKRENKAMMFQCTQCQVKVSSIHMGIMAGESYIMCNKCHKKLIGDSYG